MKISIGKIRAHYNSLKRERMIDGSPLQKFSSFRLLVDYYICRLRYGASVENYTKYEFWKLNDKGKKSFICEKLANETYRLFNPLSGRHITASKAEFNARFEAYIHRKWIDAPQSDLESFRGFIGSVERFIIKPVGGTCGTGIEIMESRDVASAEDLFRKCVDEKAILEEVVVQNGEMAAFHAKSLNTLRVVTLRDKRRDIHVMGAAFRMGTGDEVVDNFHKQGVVAVIDVDTGLVKSTATNYQHKRFVVHPDTGLPIVGFRIPHFDKVVQTVTAAAERLPEMDMVGWDVAIDRNDNVVLIEGNSLPDFDVLQIGEQGGVYDQFRPYIDERRAD